MNILYSVYNDRDGLLIIFPYWEQYATAEVHNDAPIQTLKVLFIDQVKMYQLPH